MRLEIRGLCKSYGDGARVLEDVSLSIPRGMFGLLGPNGAGKSTLMRTIATLQQPDAGTIQLGAIDAIEAPDRLRETLGYLPQEFGLYPGVSAERLLGHFAVLKGITGRRERAATVAALLRQTNLYGDRQRKLGGFSGGMRQRFGVAVALLGEPALIIVDEPTAGLDPAERSRLLNLLSELGEQAVVILSTHIVDDVTELCPRMAILDRGRIRFEGEPAVAVAALEGRIWRRTVDRSELPALAAAHRVISTRLRAGCTVAHVYSGACPGAGFEPVAAGLEDAYFCILGGHIDASTQPEPAWSR